MAKLPQVKPSGVMRVAKQLGYQVEEGRKHTVIHDGVKVITTVPRGSKAIKKGTLSGIIKDLGLTVEEFKELL